MHWLLLLVITLDLVTSPFHAHRHDVGPDHFDAPAMAAGVAGAALPSASAQELHPDQPQALGLGHSQATLRPVESRLDDAGAGATADAVVPYPVAAADTPRALPRRWTPAGDAPAPARAPFLRPAERAPPAFHA